MSSLSDTLTIGVVLVLLFGSIALYLYTRIQQAEQKVNLLESILLDVKMSAEIKSYSDLPADTSTQEQPPSSAVVSTVSSVKEDPLITEEYVMLDDHVEDLAKETPVEETQDQASPSPVEDSVYLRMEDDKDTEELVSDSSDPLLLHASPLMEKEVQYENMTLKDLQTLAKSRHISGVSTMKKGALVEALKASSSEGIVVEEIFA
jgi:hypothetical protein